MNPDNLRVCVTGANGLIGSHVVRELLGQGYRVKATLRNVGDSSKTSHLRALPGAERLEFAKLDLEQPGDCDGLLEDCDALVHCATAVRFAAKDPQREIVDVAVNGTTLVMSAAARSARTTQVVHVSSIAAILSYDKPPNYRFTVADWCDDANVQSNPYGLGKTLSERVALQLAQGSGGAGGYKLSCVNPGYVLGPVLAKSHRTSSAQVIWDILARSFPGCPSLHFNVVDVRDVAWASVKALQDPAMGQRLPLVAGGVWWSEMAQILAAEYPKGRIQLRSLPKILVYAAALLDGRVHFPMLRKILGRVTEVDGDHAAKILGLRYRSVSSSVKDTASSMLALGLLR